MINKLKTLLVAGATVITTQVQAASHTTTNLVTVDNIQVALKVYSQGVLNTHDTALAAVANSYTTVDLLKALAVISGNAFTYANGDKLVDVTTYSNFVFGTDGTTNGTPSFSVALTNLSMANIALGATGGSNDITPFFTATTTNTFIVTNDDGTIEVIKSTTTGTNVTTSLFSSTISNNPVLYTNGVADTNVSISTALLTDTNGNPLSGYTTISAVSNSPTSTNITITEVSPSTSSLFTNTGSFVAVLTPKTHSADEQLIPVGDWIDFGNFGNKVYAEAGKDLTTSNFAGTNIAAQTVYSLGFFDMEVPFPTNTPAGYMNANIDSSGFAKTTTKLQNLTVGGNSKDSQVFQVIGSEVVNVDFGSSSSTYIGGTFTTNSQTISGGVTNNNKGVSGNVGTNFISGGFISGSTNVVGTGTITVTYLSATTNITTDTNLFDP